MFHIFFLYIFLFLDYNLIAQNHYCVVIGMKKTILRGAAVFAVMILLCAMLTPAVSALGAFGSYSDILGGDFGDILSEFLGGLGADSAGGISLSDLFTNPNLLEDLQERLQAADINVSNTELIQAITAVLSDPDNLAALMGEDGQIDFSTLLSSDTFFNMIADYLQEEDHSSTRRGDVDGDGDLTAADARLTLRAAVGLEVLDPMQRTRADADSDRYISAADARLILRAAVGLEILK